MSDYKDALKVDREESRKYYASSLSRKTEQQKVLESRLRTLQLSPGHIADIACGGGGSSYHLSGLYPAAEYVLVDSNDEAIAVAEEAVRGLAARCVVGDIYDLALPADTFDLVICWQTLSWIDNPERALGELVRICRPGGRVFASSLFNPNHDVDIYASVEDHTRSSSALGMRYSYNTYCMASINRWVGKLVADVQLHEFSIPIDLEHAERGLGTYTLMLDTGRRLQLSAGMLLNWGILELRK